MIQNVQLKAKYKVIFQRNHELMKHTNVTLLEYLSIIENNLKHFHQIDQLDEPVLIENINMS